MGILGQYHPMESEREAARRPPPILAVRVIINGYLDLCNAKKCPVYQVQIRAPHKSFITRIHNSRLNDRRIFYVKLKKIESSKKKAITCSRVGSSCCFQGLWQSRIPLDDFLYSYHIQYIAVRRFYTMAPEETLLDVILELVDLTEQRGATFVQRVPQLS